MINNQELLDKIAKLMALAESSTYEGETQNAKDMIAKLLAEHNISLSKVRRGDEIITEVITIKRKKNNINHNLLFGFISRFCGCNMIYNNPSKTRIFMVYRLVGRSCDIEATKYLFDIIYRQIVSFKAEFRRKYLAPRPDVRAFERGLIEGVNNKLGELTKDMMQYQNKSGLIPINEFKQRYDEAKAYYENKHGKPKVVTRTSENNYAYYEGYEEADNINIRPPVKNEAKTVYEIG